MLDVVTSTSVRLVGAAEGAIEGNFILKMFDIETYTCFIGDCSDRVTDCAFFYTNCDVVAAELFQLGNHIE